MSAQTIEVPTSLPYPRILPLEEVAEIRGTMCFVVEHYPQDGVGVTIARDDGNVCVRVSDFAGNLLKPDDKKYGGAMSHVMTKVVPRLVYTMRVAHIPKSTYYFANLSDPVLVDVRVSLNKFASTGFVKDIFGTQGVSTQKIIGQPMQITDENIEKLQNGQGDYGVEKFILKTVVFKSIMRDDDMLPLYGIVTNEAKNAT